MVLGLLASMAPSCHWADTDDLAGDVRGASIRIGALPQVECDALDRIAYVLTVLFKKHTGAGQLDDPPALPLAYGCFNP